VLELGGDQLAMSALFDLAREETDAHEEPSPPSTTISLGSAT
jgi:hypothetical protein